MDNSWMLPLIVIVNMSKMTNALKAFLGFGFRVLLICVFVFICSRCLSKQLLVEASLRDDIIFELMYLRVVQ